MKLLLFPQAKTLSNTGSKVESFAYFPNIALFRGIVRASPVHVYTLLHTIPVATVCVFVCGPPPMVGEFVSAPRQFDLEGDEIMASIGRHRNGYKQLLWYQADKTRKTIRLGKCDIAAAREIKWHVERILSSQLSHTTVPATTAEWLGAVDDGFYEKLSRNGLCEPRKTREATDLKEAVGAYLERRRKLIGLPPPDGVTAGTVNQDSYTVDNLLEFFPDDADVADITKGTAKDWRHWMVGKYSSATVATRVKIARAIFEDLIDREILKKANPFRKIEVGNTINEDRLLYAPAEDVLKVIDHCPLIQWKLVLALCRFGGLRFCASLGMTCCGTSGGW